MSICANEHCGHEHTEHVRTFGECEGMVTDYYGTWGCMCRHFEKDTDD